MSFVRDLIRFKKKTEDKLLEIQRKSYFDLFSSIIYDSPADTGLFRNNWFTKLGDPDNTTTSSTDFDGLDAALRMALELEELTILNQKVSFYNNLPYAQRLEFGWSDQAPRGMVRINVQKWSQIVEKNVRLVNAR